MDLNYMQLLAAAAATPTAPPFTSIGQQVTPPCRFLFMLRHLPLVTLRKITLRHLKGFVKKNIG